MTFTRLFVCLVFACAAAGQAPGPGLQRLQIPKVSRAPRLADFLTHTPREAELVVTHFRQYMPGDGTPVSRATTAYLSYDDRNLYVAFECKDDPNLIRARYAKHDQIMSDDRFNLCIDT